MKICKDGRIWGQNNKEAGEHLGVSISSSRIKKGYNSNSAFSKGHLLQNGNKHWNWKGGISSLMNNIRNLSENKQWQIDVFQRDNWTCQTCNKKASGYLEAHHIKRFAEIIEANNITDVIEAQLCKELWDTNNGVTLCKNCHKLVTYK